MFGFIDTVQNFDLKLKYLKTYPGIFFFFKCLCGDLVLVHYGTFCNGRPRKLKFKAELSSHTI